MGAGTSVHLQEKGAGIPALGGTYSLGGAGRGDDTCDKGKAGAQEKGISLTVVGSHSDLRRAAR